MMSGLAPITVICLTTFVAVTPVAAWNATAHEVIAEIAYRNLSAPVKKEVQNMVATLSEEYPYIKSFAQTAAWADQLRSQKVEYFTHWHYIDIAFSTDGTRLKNITHTDNALWALEHLTPVLKNQHANPHERARALAFFIHIVGDLHQPLHTVSRLSMDFPSGDRGGNLYSLSEGPANPRNNLHHLWDNGLGLFSIKATAGNVQKIAGTIMQDFPASGFNGAVKKLDAEIWTAEGLKIARGYVYRTPEHQKPDVEYIAAGQILAEKAVALAGYRLARILNEVLM